MSLEQLFHSVESHLFNLGRSLCNDSREVVVEEAGKLLDSLSLYECRLERCRDELAHLRKCVKGGEAQSGFLASRIECYMHVHDGPNAYQHALELDEVRRRLAADRQRLRELLREERDCLDYLRVLHRRHHELRERVNRF